MTKKFVTWEDVEAGCISIANKVGDTQIDLIIGLARGGLIPARLLAQYLDVPRIMCMGISSYNGQEKTNRIVTYQQIGQSLQYGIGEKKLISESNILVVDDLSDTGDTFAYALLELCETNTPRSIKSAALYVKPDAKYIPDLYYRKLKTNPWIVFPWENTPVSIKI